MQDVTKTAKKQIRKAKACFLRVIDVHGVIELKITKKQALYLHDEMGGFILLLDIDESEVIVDRDEHDGLNTTTATA